MASKPRSAHLHPGPGFRVKMNIARPPTAMTDRLRRFPTPDVSDLLNRLYAVGASHPCPYCTLSVATAATRCPHCTASLEPLVTVTRLEEGAEVGDRPTRL